MCWIADWIVWAQAPGVVTVLCSVLGMKPNSHSAFLLKGMLEGYLSRLCLTIAITG